MTNKQINQRIAEACGWTDVHFSLAATDEFPTSRRVVGIPAGHCTHDVVPNYCNDLNAMHLAEEHLRGHQFQRYAETLDDTIGSLGGIRSTARQRAEAFLRVLGKWEEVQK